MKPRSALFSLLLLELWLAAAASAQTVISLDGSLPHGRTDVLSTLQAGPAYVVREEHGWVPAGSSNLFHSFLQFDVGAGEGVAFEASTPNLTNVIARVTGGDVSNIDGRIESRIPGADFYLLNPAGILFGPAADVDVPASLFLATASELRFANGETLDLRDANGPVLSLASPEAFGFDGNGAGEIVIASTVGSPAIEVPAGESLTIAAGRFEAFGRRTLAANGGRIQIAAVGTSALELPLADIAGMDPLDPAQLLGEVLLRDQTTLSTRNNADLGASQGTIVIRGGRFELASRAVVRAGGDPASGLAAVDVGVTGEVDVRDRARVSVDNEEAATGEIRITAERIRIRDQGLIQTLVSGTDDGSGTQDLDGGTLRLSADTIEVTDGGQVLSSSQPISGKAGDGRGGDLVLTADAVLVGSGGVVGAFAFAGGEGGSLTVQSDPASGSVRVIDGGKLLTQTSGSGRGGDVMIGGSLLEIADGSAGPAGNESAVEAGTLGAGDGGSIQVEVGTLQITRSVGSERAGRLATAVAGGATGASGNIDVSAGSMRLDGGGQISTTTAGLGRSGSIGIVVVEDATMTGQDIADDGRTPLPSGVFTRADTGDPGVLSSADAGSVRIDARNILVAEGAEISTRAIGTGTSGDIDLTATEAIRVAGESGQSSAVTARALDGQGGNATLRADLVEVLDGGRVDVSTAGSGSGGLLTVRAGELLVRGASPRGVAATATAEAGGLGDALGIDIHATRSVRIEADGEITAQAALSGTAGSPGSIAIRAPVIALVGGRVSAQAGTATGGNLTLEASREVTASSDAELSVRSSGGDAGNIGVSAPQIILRDSRIVADADAFGGEVTLEASEFVVLERSAIDALSRGGDNASGLAGGNVFVRGGGVALNRSTIVADGFGNADGGNVRLSGDPVLRSTDTRITFSSEFGLAGTLVVDAPDSNVTGDLASLPESFLDASSLLGESCVARDAPSGSFTIRQVGALPDSPDAPLRDAREGVEINGSCGP